MSFDKNLLKKEYQELIDKINYHNMMYHTYDAPEIPDATFDKLYSKLKAFEKKYPNLVTAESPTMRVGSKLLSGFSKVQHKEPMLSLANASDYDDFLNFYVRLKKDLKTDDFSLFAEPKFDGLAISITYIDGHYSSAVTRGDGVVGEDVTANVKTIKSLPLVLQGSNIPSKICLKAEIYMSLIEFENLNKKLTINNEKIFANPRNVAAGTIRQLDPKVASERNLKIFIHGLIYDDTFTDKTHSQSLSRISKYGLPICNLNKTIKSINDAQKYFKHLNDIRPTLSFEIDGIVFKIDNYKQQESLGLTSKAPKWAIAYKFKSIEVKTKLLDVTFQVGRTGIITPVAELESVNIGGVNVSRASLHNMDEINRKDIRINDIVYVKRAGDVIPEIDRVSINQRTRSIKIKTPKKCPACGSILNKISSQSIYKCTNQHNCKPQIIQTIQHFASRKAMNISGLGESIIESLVDSKTINNFTDLYHLNMQKLLNIERMAEKSSKNLLNSIQKSKNNSFDRLIYALGIHEVGMTTSKSLASNFKNMDSLMTASIEDLCLINDIGEIVAENIFEYFRNKYNKNNIKKLFNIGLQITYSSKNSMNLSEKTYVITGSFINMSRQDIEQSIIDNGGRVTGSISNKTTALILGLKPGSKLDKAKKLNIDIITEEEFFKLL